MLVEFEKSGLLEQAIAKIRDKETQPPEFRKNLRRIGRYLFYEASKNFDLKSEKVMTPLSEAEILKIEKEVVIISVLRASLPMVDAVFEELDEASLGVVSASRGEMLDEKGQKFRIKSDYMKLPSLEGKIAILVDPMLATASTISFLLDEVQKREPSKIILICAIASEYGINEVVTNYPNVAIYAGDVDAVLNDHGYIVPGLGDAGDRACNTPH